MVEVSIGEASDDIYLNVSGKLVGHSGKKFCVNVLTNSDLGTMTVIFRCGWEMRNVHTIFEYTVRSDKHDIMASKVIAGWRYKHGDNYLGGIPPRPIHIRDPQSRKAFVRFCERLFEGPSSRYVILSQNVLSFFIGTIVYSM